MMRGMLLAVGILAAFPLCAAEFTPEQQQELEKLQGKWRIVSTERDGMVEQNPPEPVSVKVEGDKLLLNENEAGLRITLLGLDSKPRLINITQLESKKVLEGIYELTNDQWRVCLSDQTEGASERPVDFETRGKLKFLTVILTREK